MTDFDISVAQDSLTVEEAAQARHERLAKAYHRGIISTAEFETQRYCQIEINRGDSAPEVFCLAITFHNVSKSPIHCSFGLSSPYWEQRAAFFGLNITDENNSPVRVAASDIAIQGRIKWIVVDHASAPVIEPKGKRTFELRGKLENELLQFHQYALQVERGKVYNIYFQYVSLTSNTIQWAVPI